METRDVFLTGSRDQRWCFQGQMFRRRNGGSCVYDKQDMEFGWNEFFISLLNKVHFIFASIFCLYYFFNFFNFYFCKNFKL